jgi:hypothetical protein
MKLSTLALCLGIGFSIPQLFALAKPDSFAARARSFPRSEPWGWVLMIIGTSWFLYNLTHEAIADFAAYKNLMVAAFGLIGFLTCIFVRDFLAVRGFAITILMLAWFTLNTARWADSPWRLVLVVWAYLWIIAGMWFTVSPWRMRDHIYWMTEKTSRLRATSAIRLLFGIFVAALGLIAFK